MRIVSFNVNGIRAILSKGFENTFNSLNADILSLNETKWSDNENFAFYPDGYHVYFTNSKVEKGYSGVAVFSKIKPLNVTYGLENGEYDDEGRVITLEFSDFYYVACYVPNAGDGLKRLDFRMEFEKRMKNYLISLDQNKPVIYGGDLNVAHKEIDLKNPKANEKNPGYTIEERTAFSELLENNFIDTYRYKYPDSVKYSWWSYRFNARANNAGWRIDYFVVSDRLKEKVEDSKIHNDIMGSDHCPIELIIKI
jgi:exodeoxyribonuclease-3